LAAVRSAVDHDDARLHAFREAQRAMQARRVDRRGEPVRGVVDEYQRLLEIAHAVEDRDGAEQLGARELRIERNVFDDRRLEPPPGPVDAPPARQRARTGQGAQDALEALLADDRSRLVALRLAHEALAELLVDGIEDDDPARRGTPLPGVREGRRERPLDGAVQV